MTLAPKLIIMTFLFTALVSTVTSSTLRGHSAMNREQRLLVDTSLQTSGNVQERAGNKTIYFGYDEARLDKNEGVPHAYTKEVVKTKFWPVKNPHKPSEEPARTSDWVDVKNKTLSQDIGMLVYINRERIEETKPWEEYISRMNAGITDAMTCGIPEEYVSQVIRPFIPKDKLAVPYSWGGF
ncbi:hypothetical protein FH972_025652 [Carpinus fangiana]|uniref:Amine oxidase n=1 Tax=Carpinus fangiana TaxID=176857 RepID=A0A5N6L1R0_9ROSI|nr:hypothetical protein FH972_025652 [Carpinus fangiana]